MAMTSKYVLNNRFRNRSFERPLPLEQPLRIEIPPQHESLDAGAPNTVASESSSSFSVENDKSREPLVGGAVAKPRAPEQPLEKKSESKQGLKKGFQSTLNRLATAFSNYGEGQDAFEVTTLNIDMSNLSQENQDFVQSCHDLTTIETRLHRPTFKMSIFF